MRLVLESIVEGHGEEQSLRTLVNNILHSLQSDIYPEVRKPFRINKDKLKSVRLGELERYAEMALVRGGPNTRLLILVDADDDCPAELGPQFAGRVQTVAQRYPQSRYSVNVANREYEAWFIASLETIAPPAGIELQQSSRIPTCAETIRGAKEWISERMPAGQSYSPTADQARFTSALDVALARQRSQSFDRLCREIQRLLSA